MINFNTSANETQSFFAFSHSSRIDIQTKYYLKCQRFITLILIEYILLIDKRISN